MRREGIKIMSYFITGSYERDSESSAFKLMYGKDSIFIDTNKINDIAKTMNKKFLEVV